MSAYESWLKKREFKVPRSSATGSPPAKLSEHSGVSASKRAAEGDDELPQHERQQASVFSSKFHAVSGVETTQVTVKSVDRPAAVGKRPRSWLSSREKAAGREEETKVAGAVAVTELAAAKVAGRKRLPVDQNEVIQAPVLKLASASKVLRLPSTKRDKETSMWSGRVDSEAKVAAEVTLPDVKVTSVKDLLDKEAETTRKRSVYDTESGDNTKKRFRFDVDEEGSESSGLEAGLPPKSPFRKKQRTVRTAMLDESQYWMAVDRFSQLT